nr:ShET2/EspL2 family type III secretion system effector toxin [Thalassotalea sp. G20_0]
MYYSNNERSETLNCKVHRSACDRKDAGKRIECRHLSWGYVTGVFGRGKHSFHPVDSRSALKVYSHRFPTDKDLRDHFNEKHCGEGYYFARSTFSHAIQSIAEKYWNMPNGTDKAFLVWFNTHSMALRFKKQEGCIKVIFYDPNDTGRHKTFPLYDPGNARALELEDYCFLPDSHEFDSGIILSDDTREHIEQCNVNVFGDVDFQLLDGNIEHLAGHKDHPTIKASRRRNPGVNRRQG